MDSIWSTVQPYSRPRVSMIVVIGCSEFQISNAVGLVTFADLLVPVGKGLALPGSGPSDSSIKGGSLR